MVAAELESRKFKRPFPPAAYAHPLFPLVPALGSGHTPRAVHTARGRLCSPRHREPPPGIGGPEAGRPTGSRKQPSGCWQGISSPGAPTGLSKAREGQHHCSMDGSQCEGRELCLVQGRPGLADGVAREGPFHRRVKAEHDFLACDA